MRGIGDGTLPLERFQYYMAQDYVFLVEFLPSHRTGRGQDRGPGDMAWFSRLLHETLNTEMSLHVSFCEDFGITEGELRETAPSPTTQAYTQHLVRSGYSGSAGEVAAAILPCSWGYSEIGRTLEDRGLPESQPLYCRWITMYSSAEFAELAEWLRGFLDRTAAEGGEAERKRMEEAFTTSSRFEYMFWDAAYRMEKWPI